MVLRGSGLPEAGAQERAEGSEPRAVPAPTASTSVVTVKTGGDRNGDTSVAPLAGVRLGLYAAEDGGTPAFTCVSDADGDCSFVVTGTAAGGANQGRQFWVRQVAAHDGWFVNDTFRTGGTVTTPYRFQTPRLEATPPSGAAGPKGRSPRPWPAVPSTSLPGRT